MFENLPNRIPGFPNVFPWNNLLLDGKLNLQKKPKSGVKTRSWNWKYRGPILLYTSHRLDGIAMERHHIEWDDSGGMIVGIGNLVYVDELSVRERVKMFELFNRVSVSRKKIDQYLFRTRNWRAVEEYFLHRIVYPLPFGFFFENLTSFASPVPFKWPMGAVRNTWVDTVLVADAIAKAQSV